MAVTISFLPLSPKLTISPFYSSLSTSFAITFPSTKPRILEIFCCLSLKQTNHQIGTTQNDAVDNLRVVFAAGGTGGRIYPAVAIADELRITNPTCEILFIGTSNSMESTAITSAGYNFTTVPAVRLARPFISPRNLFLPCHLLKSLIQCFHQLRDFGPRVVVGTGGFVSFPVCLAAKLKGIKLVIQEQNSVPGIANWVLSFFADVVFVAFNSTIDSFPRNKCVATGNPIRLSLRQYVPKEVARLHFFPTSGKTPDYEAKVLLILGGSLGANAINIAMLNLYYQMLMENKNLFIIWQTGVEAYYEMESLVKDHQHLYLTPFVHSMELAYAAADLIVSRAGAMTCYEILATGKPSILIPSPEDAEGHQYKNASLLADLAGSRVITEDELDSTTLAIAIHEILGDEDKMADMSERALKAAKPNASADIVQHILSLLN
ncbi:UDP-N-acetylglucosamine--N-acetylmuramyl-(Pentapeptide) pyrophosphoryl-undecaprenol N-acetylglucosamine transferase [Quillaja saponaria]|uniref:UDP-N-acetylglucosamine--N-acetylmuramyl-(Pentapeptide) pyrophosphoryl-undecaprenol N-acetylglucosamine transferase n=1 Tax=Quillaja saponaria TaxID=32244 RepID=A0AAD7M7K3_QUISA|nr:UDP-N-acetylglucosamine--N-acetylmuramyl-(Pentapeptide) pyrophosphoryl-undecaprenol N-acetylglucosamine transferase [Quillaja saponaria]